MSIAEECNPKSLPSSLASSLHLVVEPAGEVSQVSILSTSEVRVEVYFPYLPTYFTIYDVFRGISGYPIYHIAHILTLPFTSFRLSIPNRKIGTGIKVSR